MKTIIFYFTGTGNSFSAAKKIQEELGETELIRITGNLLDNPVSITGDRLGFIFPNYFSVLPEIVETFIKKLEIPVSVKYIFSVITAGGTQGIVFDVLKDILKQKNKTLDYTGYINMPGNYIIAGYYEFTNRSEKGKQKLFKSLDTKINRITTDIKNEKKRFIKSNFLFRQMAKNIEKEKIKTYSSFREEAFFADENCNSCNTCVKVCPVSNIEIIEKKPSWSDKCQLCMSCIHLCPQNAIQYKDKTQNKTRYQNPSINIKEFYII